MQRQIQVTADGSHTISIPKMNVTYHSKHGAVQESMHVFIEAGLLPLIESSHKKDIRILEIGFGTGLNALLSWRTAKEYQQRIIFTTIEPYPLSEQEWRLLNYGELLDTQEAFAQLHAAAWETPVQLDEYFTIEKKNVSLSGLILSSTIDCIFFDAFDPVTQPGMWTQPVFEKLFASLTPGGRLLTYCSKSIVRHAMTAAGFRVTKVPGPKGKREMVAAYR